MPHLPIRLPKLMALATSAAFAALLFAGSGQAEAGYYQPYRSYGPSYGYGGYPAYGGYGYRYYGNGHDEVRELQRLFPSTNWPPSMRYYSQ
jgi:hypothetical protein